MFTSNTWDSSSVNSKSKALGIYTWTVKCITCKRQWGVVWMACTCTTVGKQIIVVLLAFTVFSFLPKLERSAEQLLAADLSYIWLYPSKQAVDRYMLFVRLDRVVLLPGTLSQGRFDGGSLCPCCWRWQIGDCKEYKLYYRSHWHQDKYRDRL